MCRHPLCVAICYYDVLICLLIFTGCWKTWYNNNQSGTYLNDSVIDDVNLHHRHGCSIALWYLIDKYRETHRVVFFSFLPQVSGLFTVGCQGLGLWSWEFGFDIIEFSIQFYMPEWIEYLVLERSWTTTTPWNLYFWALRLTMICEYSFHHTGCVGSPGRCCSGACQTSKRIPARSTNRRAESCEKQNNT